jgi:pyruvate ferredoxin oxidoreductase delta subunit
MAIKKQFSFPLEGPWSDASQQLLCLETGTWRTARPHVDIKKCTYCGLCSLYCPPHCMLTKDDHFEPNLEYCKGCGVCAKECPTKAISMVPEG